MGVGRRAHEKAPGGRGRSSPRGWRRSVPVRSAGDGVAREGVELSGSTRWDMGPTAKFCLSQNRVSFIGPRDGHGHRGVHGSRKLTRFGPVLDPRATPPRRSMLSPDSPTRFGWAHSLGRESGGWVSPRDPAPQGAPPATTGLTQATAARPSQMGLSRCLKILVGLMMSVQRHRCPLISEKSNHCRDCSRLLVTIYSRLRGLVFAFFRCFLALLRCRRWLY